MDKSDLENSGMIYGDLERLRYLQRIKNLRLSYMIGIVAGKAKLTHNQPMEGNLNALCLDGNGGVKTVDDMLTDMITKRPII